MNLKEFFSVSCHDFPKVTRRIRYSLHGWNEYREAKVRITASNIDFTSLLGEDDIVRALEAYEKSPLKNSENRDLYCLFRCYQYSVWHMPWSRSEMIDEWKYYNQPSADSDPDDMQQYDDELCRIETDCDENEITNMLVCHFADKVSAKAHFAINGLALEECVLCPNKHDAMMYQQLLYLAYPEQAKNGRSVLYCKQCGEPFIGKGKNAQYCERCSTPSARTMRSRRNSMLKAKKED